MTESDQLPHIPVLRAGKAYESLDVVELTDHRNGEPVARVSQANAGMIRRDMKRALKNRAVLRAVPVHDLIECCQNAADLFLEETLSTGLEGSSQSPADYVASLSSTSGLPHTLCRSNMEKVATVMRELPTILSGLMRGLDLSVIDGDPGEAGTTPLWFTAESSTLGAVLPSNSPGVHSLWIPAIALKVPVVLKPGREEPWTPMRIAQALMRAGVPPEAFSLYPTDHEGARTILSECGRSLLFGGGATTEPYLGNPAVEVHGPGRSKVLLGADQADDWEQHLDVLVASVAGNSGRSCVNASAIFVSAHADEIAEALAQRLAGLVPRPHGDTEAGLAAFANADMAAAIDGGIEAALGKPGALDVARTARLAHRTGGEPRCITFEGGAYLLPTVVRCTSRAHALANTEYLFPFTSVVEMPQDEMLASIGPSLVVSAITRDETWIAELLASTDIHRLNVGPVPTNSVQWDQPHEGNLFEFLYIRRAFQRASEWN